jgi:hypothetical protein
MKRILSTLCLALLASTAYAQSQASSGSSSTYNVDAAKAAATGMATQMRGSTPVIQNGEMQRDGNQMSTERVNAGSGSSQMDYFKNVTGTSGAVPTGTGRDGNIGGQTSTTTSIDFSCKSEGSARKTSGGYVFQLGGCQVSGNTVAGVTVSLCTALHRGGSCSSSSAFSAPQQLPANTYATIDGVKLGLGCNDSNAACRLTVTGTYSMSTNTTDFDKTMQQKAAANGGDSNSAQGAVVAMRTKKNADGTNAYDTAMADQGQTMAACAQGNSDKVNAGQSATTCDGSKTVSVTNAPSEPAPDCSQSKQCARTAVQTTSFTRSCTRTFPLTANVCNFTTKTKACSITWAVTATDPVTQQPTAWKEVSSCSDTDIAGATKFHFQDSTTCGASHTVPPDTTPICDHYNRTDFYSWPAEQVGDCRGDPYTVGGSCVSSSASMQCSSGRWFGRTKNALDCVIADMNDPSTVPTEVGHNIIAGCGVCEASQVGTTCYAAQPLAWGDPLNTSPIDKEDTCAAMDLTGCTLASTDQVTPSETGLVTTQRENYTCTRQTESCVEYKQDPRCKTTTVSNFGMDAQGFRAPASDAAMNQALAATAMANSVSGAVSDANSVDSRVMPLLFSGEGQHCVQPTGSWGSNGYYMDCCKISLERPGGKFGKLNKCTEEEAHLAAARRANYTVYLGDWCSKRLPWPLKSCIQRTQGYCAFPGVLPRIIHEQGRAQLAQMAASSSTTTIQKGNLSFPYYGTSGTWAAPVVVNGVTVSAWQWPTYCQDMAQAAKALEADPMAKDCPVQLTNYFAACDNPAGCGALPEYPELGSEHWVLTTADPLKNVTTAVSRYAVVTGVCDPRTNKCGYDISAWPAGTGGRAVVSKEVAFSVYVTPAEGQTSAYVAGELSNVGDYMFRPDSVAVPNGVYPSQLPATVRLNFSSDGGQTWSALDIPTSNNTDLSLPGTDAKLSGQCSQLTNLCRFKMTGTATVTTLPWGSAQNPNCKGFTAGQLSVLDFSKMDFSEWLSTVASNIKAPDGSSLASVAQTQMTQYNNNNQAGADTTMTMAAPQGGQLANVTPAEGFGASPAEKGKAGAAKPFIATLKVAGYWPMTYGDPAKDTDAVTAVSVDWGDCTSVDSATFISQINGQPARGFMAQHEYISPQYVPTACGGGGGDAASARNLSHTLKLRVTTTKSGVQTVTLQVKNAYDTMPGAYRMNSDNSANSTPTTSTTVPAKLTTPPPGN